MSPGRSQFAAQVIDTGLRVEDKFGVMDSRVMSEIHNNLGGAAQWTKTRVQSSVLADLGSKLAQRLYFYTPKATGRLANSTTWHISSDQTTLYVSQNQMNLGGQLYGRMVRSGGSPHMPPLEPIQIWLQAKFGFSLDLLNIRVRQVAWAVAKGIERDGTEANTYAYRTVRNSRDLYAKAEADLGMHLTTQITR